MGERAVRSVAGQSRLLTFARLNNGESYDSVVPGHRTSRRVAETDST